MAGPFIKPKYYGTRTTRGLPPKQYPGALDGLMVKGIQNHHSKVGLLNQLNIS